MYDKEFDQQKRIAIIREIDGILAKDYQYLLTWEEPFSRIAFWNKFGHPEGYLSRIGDYREASSLWWIDPDRDQQLKRATSDPSIKFQSGPVEKRFWQEYDKTHPFGGSPSQ